MQPGGASFCDSADGVGNYRSHKSAWTKTDYKKVLKTFYRWLGRPELLEWLTVRPPESALQPEDLMDASDVQRMIDTASSDRDRAFIAAMYDGAFRIGEIGSVAIKNVVFEKYCTRLSVSGKTGRRTVTLIYARPYLARWLEVHPFSNDPDAPLLIDMQKLREKVGLDYDGLRAILRRTAAKAGIKKKAGNPHLYRHSRATPLALELPGPVFEQFMGWSPGSRMVQRYVHLADRAADPFLFRAAGLEVPDDQRKKAQVLQCPFCRAPNSLSARVCSKCLMPLREEEIRTREEKMMGLATAIVDLLSQHPGSADIFQKYLKELQ